jgi:molecular chaperone GrpE
MQDYSEELRDSEAEPESEGQEDIDSLKLTLAEEKKRAEEYLANWQRAQADFINYRRRTEQDRLEFNRYANSQLALALLPVLDDLERALEAVPPKLAKNEWVEGIKLVGRKFESALEGQGITPVDALGKSFDPNYHEALRQDKGEEGMVIDVFQKGYMLGNKVLRPAKVVVGNGEEEAKEENLNG